LEEKRNAFEETTYGKGKRAIKGKTRDKYEVIEKKRGKRKYKGKIKKT